jgi:hypothetical protein
MIRSSGLLFSLPSLLALGVLGLGCSASNSSETISDSISSPFEWSSDSSGSLGGDSAYRRDVSDYTVAFEQHGGDWSGFRAGIGQLAEQRGITNWEEDVYTCASIGFGLKQQGADEARAHAFGEDLFGANTRSQSALLAGYASTP